MIQLNYHIVFVVVIMLLSRSVYLFLKLSHNFYPAPDEVVARCIGLASDVRPSRRLSVHMLFPEQISEAHGWIYFIVCVDVPFGISEV